MALRSMVKGFSAALLIGMINLITFVDAHAVPSFSRQTGMSCSVCHTVFPELTAFGRFFKLTGFTQSAPKKPEACRLPLAAMVQASYTQLNENNGVLKSGVAPFDNAEDAERDKFNLPQEVSIFYGGKIIDHVGALTELAYEGPANDIALDHTDVRFARTASLWNKPFVFGLTVNNSPTVEDIWNTTPVWGFPFASSEVAPSPAASTIIDGPLGLQVGGIGGYASWANWLYGVVSVYRTTRDGITRPLGAGTEPETLTDGAVPYWRFAVYHSFGSHSFELGTYGIKADVFPTGEPEGPTDSFRDYALDAQYQYISSPHIFSFHTTWITERQDRDASLHLGLAANDSDDLRTFKANANYYYRSRYGTFGGTVAYFSTTGDTDELLYAPDPVEGSRTGSPESKGFILEAFYLWKEKYRFSLQYTIYDRFNGAGSDYDGFGRDASDNNTLYALVWLAF